jgi:TIR domain
VAIRPDDDETGPLQGRVFISYSRRDKLAADVAEELRQQGFDVWLDTESIPGAVGISRGIKAADAVVLLMSPMSRQNPSTSGANSSWHSRRTS